MVVLENDFLKLKIDYLGAQLRSVMDKTDNVEHLWQADESVWGYSAPNLFPIVGGCVNDKILIDGKEFSLKRHGFARNSFFSLEESTIDSAQFSLKFSEETLKSYPYLFDFRIIYQITKNEIRVIYKVINLDDQEIYFSVGAHPAFNIPFSNTFDEKYTDYYLEFDEEVIEPTHLLSKDGFFTGETELVNFDKNILNLNKELFINDALIFKNIRSKSIKIKSRKNNKSIHITYPHFNYLGIWAKYGAPFICIEPWHGCADAIVQTEFSDKEGIQKLQKGHVFETEFKIKITSATN